MQDEISHFIIGGERAGNYAPHVKVWSEMEVRVIVLRVLQSAQPQNALDPATPECPAPQTKRRASNFNRWVDLTPGDINELV